MSVDGNNGIAGQPTAEAWTRGTLAGQPVTALLDNAVATFPDRTAIHFLGRRWSYRTLAALADRTAHGLQRIGVRPGDRVGICLPNTPYSVIFYQAILRAGAVVVNFNPLYVERELAYQIRDSGTSVMVVPDLAAIFGKVANVAAASGLSRIVVCPMAGVLPPGKALLYRLFKRRETLRPRRADRRNGRRDSRPDDRRDGGRDDRWAGRPDDRPDDRPDGRPADRRALPLSVLLRGTLRPNPVLIDPQAIAVLQYTGGTTGVPKAAALTHANLTSNAEQSRLGFGDMRSGAERVLGVLPLFHVFGMTCVMNVALLMAAEMILLPRFDLRQVLRTIERLRPTVFPAVPTIYSAIVAAAERRRYDLASIRFCISGGAPLPGELRHRFEALTGCRLVEGYGLSETSPVVSFAPPDGAVRDGSAGRPVLGTTVEIRDPAAIGRLLPPGEKGEICVRGPQVMAGYWQRPEETAAVMIDGALRTGDIGYLDADGYLFLVDRIKDVIICGGYNVYPRVLEEALYQHPAVRDAVVIGIPDAYRGQSPKAFVTLRPGATATPAELIDFLSGYVSRIELPKQLEIRADLPRTPIGKLSKQALLAEEAASPAGA